MYKLKKPELLQLCNILINAPQPYYPVASDFLADSNYTGCRPMELLEKWRWQMIPPDNLNYYLTPQKNNSQRIIPKAGFSNSFNKAFEDNFQPYNSLSLRQLQISIKKINPAGRMIVGDRECNTYIYRYNKVNQMIIAGYTWSEIQKSFGWYNPTMPYSYHEREVFVTVPPPW